MGFREEVKNMSNKELIREIRECGCDSDYKGFWDIAMNELEIRLGVKTEKIEKAIEYFKYGISHNIFSEDMIKISEIYIETLERMKDDIK